MPERIALLFRASRVCGQDKKGAADRAARVVREGADARRRRTSEAAEALSAASTSRAGDAKKLVGGLRGAAVARRGHRCTRDVVARDRLALEEKLRNPPSWRSIGFLEAFVARSEAETCLRDDLDPSGWQGQRLGQSVRRVRARPSRRVASGRRPTICVCTTGQALAGRRPRRRSHQAVPARCTTTVADDQQASRSARASCTARRADYAHLLRSCRAVQRAPDVARRAQDGWRTTSLRCLAIERQGARPRPSRAYIQNIPLEFRRRRGRGVPRARGGCTRPGRNAYDNLARRFEHRIDIGPGSDEELASLKFRLRERAAPAPR